MHLPSNEDIQNTLKIFKDNQIKSCVDYFSHNEYSHCHIYFLLYTMKHYKIITNNFPDGLFKCVR
jgi:hypothetical protein